MQSNIFKYVSYRQFLVDFYAWKKASQNGFSYRQFSGDCGFKSPNFLKLVIEGKRNLTPASQEKVIYGLHLNRDETIFFKKLVRLNQAKSLESKQQLTRELLRSKTLKRMKPLARAQYEYWAKWYNVPIRDLVALKGFREDPNWIAQKLIPRISPEQAGRALKDLIKLGLLQRNARGRLEQTQKLVTTGDEVAAGWVVQFHREMIQKAKESLEQFSHVERQVSSVTFSCSDKHLKKIQKRVSDFRKEILDLIENDPHANGVYQFNFQLFPLTQKIDS